MAWTDAAGDARWMGAALALARRGRGRCAPNPNVGCIIVREGIVVGRGWTQPGGRPHAEAMALAEAREAAAGATAFVTLEPCAHLSERGPACANLLVAAGIGRVAAAMRDPDPRTAGRGFGRLRDAGVEVVEGIGTSEAEAVMAGFLTRRRLGRPHVTLKLALSLDGRIALADGSSKWITGAAARAHAHLERSRHEAIVVGRGTLEVDAPALDVRLSGLEHRAPRRFLLTHQSAVSSPSTPPAASLGINAVETWSTAGTSLDDDARESGWDILADPKDIAALEGVDHVLVEGGGRAAAAFLAADLVDCLLIYRAPILIGAGVGIGDIGLRDLVDAHGRWAAADARTLGSDRLEVYERRRS